MRTIELQGKKVELYDAIEELPILRFHKYNKMLLVDSGIGSDMADFDRHIEKAIRFAASKTPQHAITELQNLRQNVYFIQSNISPRYMAFAVLVKSIDGKECNDLSDEALRKIVETFGNVPHNELTAHLEAVKKKIDDELRLYFPKLFEDATIKEYYDQLRQRTLIVLKTIIAGKATEKDAKEIDDITAALITYFNPQIFAGSESVEIKYDRQFENMCLVISQHLHSDPKTYTVLAYYNAFEYIKAMMKDVKGKKGAK